MDIYVGNLPWSMDDDGLKQLFEDHGEVSSAKIIKDRDHIGLKKIILENVNKSKGKS